MPINIFRRRQWQPTPVLLPGKSHGQKSLVGCSPWGHWESDMTEWLHFHFSLFIFMHWRRKWHPIPLILPGESQGQGSLVGCCLWGRRVGDDWSNLAAANTSPSLMTWPGMIFTIYSPLPWRRQWHPTPVLLPGKSHGWRSLIGCSPWGHKESDTTERLHFDFSLSCIGEGNGNPLQYSCLENPRNGEARWAVICEVAQSQTRLKWLSSSSSSSSINVFILCFNVDKNMTFGQFTIIFEELSFLIFLGLYVTSKHWQQALKSYLYLLPLLSKLLSSLSFQLLHI